MKPDIQDAINQAPKSSYNYEAHLCRTPQKLAGVIEQNKDREGFYIYGLVPQRDGVMVVFATKNPEAFLDTKPRIELGLQPLKEQEAKTINVGMFLGAEEDTIDTWLTLLYEQGYEVCKRVEKEVKE